MRPWYADDYRGWPVAPRNRQHPVRGSWLDPRRKELYHPGIDISVRDDRPERGAPPGRTHRVYALEGGPVWKLIQPKSPTKEGIVRIGHFTYGHVEPVVQLGQVVEPGQLIAWTTDTEWHLHLSEWRFPGGKPNEKKPDPGEPARPGRQDRAVFATHCPRTSGRSASTGRRTSAWRTKDGSAVFPPGGAPLDASRLSGLVDVRAHILDRQSFRGWFRDVPLLETDHHPARVHLHVDRATDGKRVVDRDVFTSDVWPGPESPRRDQISISHHYAPGTRMNLRAHTALLLNRQGRGELWFRLFAGPRRKSCYWDTTAFRDGPYRLTVEAWDLVGNQRGRLDRRRHREQRLNQFATRSRRVLLALRPTVSSTVSFSVYEPFGTFLVSHPRSQSRIQKRPVQSAGSRTMQTAIGALRRVSGRKKCCQVGPGAMSS